MPHPRWLENPPPSHILVPASTAAERTKEQDEAAGGREKRRVRLTGGRVATASVTLDRFPRNRRVYAYVRYKTGGRNVRLYVGEVNADTRNEALQRAWELVKEKGVLEQRR